MAYSPLWHPGQTLGVVAPASAPRAPEKLERGLNALAEDGYLVHWDPSQLAQRGYLSGSDAERAAQFHRTLTHTRHLIAVRGGYGCLRILNRIDYAAAQRTPGVLIGYSDITALQLSLFTCSGWRSISGPVVVEWDSIPATMKEEVRLLLEGQLPLPIEGLTTVRKGQCTGTLLGGNLSTIARMVGSRYLPDLEKKLLFIEDVNEAPYRIDALLTQLKNAGILEGLGGLIIGNFTGDPSRMDQENGDIMIQTILNCVDGYSWPVVSGLEYGHFPSRRVLPIGVSARLGADPNGGCLEILDSIAKP